MKMQLVAVVLLVAMASCFANRSLAQVVLNRHSTVAGDYIGAMAEYRRADGEAQLNSALAAQQWIKAAEQYDIARSATRERRAYERVQRELQMAERIAEKRRARQQYKLRQLQLDAQRASGIRNGLRLGFYNWPRALQDESLSEDRYLVEETLADHEISMEQQVMILQFASDVRRRVQEKSLGQSHLERVEAMKVVRALEIVGQGGIQPSVASL